MRNHTFSFALASAVAFIFAAPLAHAESRTPAAAPTPVTEMRHTTSTMSLNPNAGKAQELNAGSTSSGGIGNVREPVGNMHVQTSEAYGECKKSCELKEANGDPFKKVNDVGKSAACINEDKAAMQQCMDKVAANKKKKHDDYMHGCVKKCLANQPK